MPLTYLCLLSSLKYIHLHSAVKTGPSFRSRLREVRQKGDRNQPSRVENLDLLPIMSQRL